MRLLPDEQKMFASMCDRPLGKKLAAYLRRLQTDACDVRNLKGKPIEAAIYASEVLQEVIDKIVLQNPPKEHNPDEYV